MKTSTKHLLLVIVGALSAVGGAERVHQSQQAEAFVGIGGFVPPTQAGGGGGGSGTVTSVASASGDITVTNPATSADLAIEYTTHAQKRITGTAAAHTAMTGVNADGTITTAGVVNTASNGTNTTCAVVAGAVSCSNAYTPTTAAAGQSATGQNADGTAAYGTLQWSQATEIDIYDDFFNIAAAGPVWALGTVGTGSAGVNGSSISASGHPGILDVELGATAASSELIHTGNSGIVFSGGVATAETYAMIPNASSAGTNELFEFGFADSAGGGTLPVDGAWFLYDPQNVSTLNAAGGTTGSTTGYLCVSRNNSATTIYQMNGVQVSDASFTTINQAFNAGSLPSTNWVKFKVTLNAAGTEADYFVNDVLSCKITTNLPTTAARATSFQFRFQSTAGSANRALYVDWFHGHMTLTTPRAANDNVLIARMREVA